MQELVAGDRQSWRPFRPPIFCPLPREVDAPCVKTLLNAKVRCGMKNGFSRVAVAFLSAYCSGTDLAESLEDREVARSKDFLGRGRWRGEAGEPGFQDRVESFFTPTTSLSSAKRKV